VERLAAKVAQPKGVEEWAYVDLPESGSCLSDSPLGTELVQMYLLRSCSNCRAMRLNKEGKGGWARRVC